MKCEVMVIATGANMDKGTISESKIHLEAQNKELIKVVKPVIDAGTKAFLIDPFPGPVNKEEEGGTIALWSAPT
jgi:hypothetical protein